MAIIQEPSGDDDVNAPVAANNSGDSSGGVGGGGGLASGQVFGKTGLASGQDFTPQSSQADVDVSATPERQNFDKDIAYAKKSMYISPDDNQMYSRERGLAPSINAARLEKRGIDVPALIGRVGRKEGGSIKNYTHSDGKINLGHGRVSTASKGKHNSSW